MYTTSEGQLELLYKTALADRTVNSYPEVHSHLQALYE